MAGPGCRLLRLACVTLALAANCAAVTAARSVTTITPTGTTDIEGPRGRELKRNLKQVSRIIQTPSDTLTSEGLTSDLLLSISLGSVVLLLAFVLSSVGLVVALNRRATRGTYSPSRQEKEGSRVEMWSITQPPPVERLI